MKTLQAALLAGAAFAALAATATAQEIVRVGELEVTRIVIAPPQDDLSKRVRDGLKTRLETSQTGSRTHQNAQNLYYFYGGRYFEPLWLVETPDGAIAFSPAARAILEVFETAHLDGLDPADYLTDALDVRAAGKDPARLAALESAFSAAVQLYAQHAYSGRLDPRTVSEYVDIAPKLIDTADLMARLSSSADSARILKGLHPTHREFVALRSELAKHYEGGVVERRPIGGGPLIRLGGTDARVPLLRERLGLPAEGGQTYDASLRDAVVAFQSRLGLNPDGVVGPATIGALNGVDGASKADLIANMERWRWMPEDLGAFNVFVNIPEYRLEVIKDGVDIYDTRVIVGTLARQTPLFSDQIRHVVTNPYWNVPPTIMNEDVLPRILSNPAYLESQNMELLYGGRVVNIYAIDWTAINLNSLRVRQRPGSSNSLGQVKFLFPNKHDVYLHDTPSRGLFARTVRTLSSGCVRVEDPFAFAQALLEFEPNLTVASLENSLGPSERWFNLDRRVPVHLAYFTLRVSEDGTLRAYGDPYGHDATVKTLLGLQ